MDASCPGCDRDHARGAPECPGQRVGTVFAGKYRILRVLGAGGMGIVFEVEHLALGRRSALKLLLGRRLGELAMERFKREAQRLASLKSPAIVQVFDAGQDEDGAPFLEMELLDGASLEEVLRSGPLDPARAVEIVRGALLGLDVAHSAGLVHRDIKPDNVFVLGDTQRSTEVKLLDFGIAKATEGEEGLTRDGVVLGTVMFMAPEQARGAAGADARSDVYSMGATLYRALTGEYPVEPGPTISVVARIVTGQVSRRPRSIVGAVPPWLDAIVARAMAPQPEDRYASAREMREALGRKGAPASIAAHEGDERSLPPMPVLLRVTRPEVSVRAMAPEAPAPATGPEVPAQSLLISAPRSEERLLAAPRPRSRGAWAGAAAVLAIGVTGGVVMLRSTRPDIVPKGVDARPGPTGAPAPSASVLLSPSPRALPLPGMVALPGGAMALGTPEGEQTAALARCRSELAIDAHDCTAPRLAREVPGTAALGAYDLDQLEVDNASFVGWARGQLASGKAQLDAKGVVRAEGLPIVQTGSQNAGIDAVGGSLAVRPGFEKRPAVLVSWIGASRFCAEQGKRLPSEAEWEAAARGERHAEFPWGDEVPSCEDVAFGGSARSRCPIRAARDVGASPRDVTRAGVHDLGGNAMEWVDGPGDAPDAHPMRGGSWAGSAFEARSARRRFGKATEMLGDVGFRCARDGAR